MRVSISTGINPQPRKTPVRPCPECKRENHIRVQECKGCGKRLYVQVTKDDPCSPIPSERIALHDLPAPFCDMSPYQKIVHKPCGPIPEIPKTIKDIHHWATAIRTHFLMEGGGWISKTGLKYLARMQYEGVHNFNYMQFENAVKELPD